jgi:hypothetical protein
MESYMNKPEVKKQLGAPADITFQSCNMQINQAFLLQGDGMHNAGALLPELVNNGIRLLLYAGEADMRKSPHPCIVDHADDKSSTPSVSSRFWLTYLPLTLPITTKPRLQTSQTPREIT